MASTISTMAMPGGIHSHHWSLSTRMLWAAASMFPQDGWGWRTPRPRKLSAASASTPCATASVA
ncbi:hypothetical protein D3C71_2126030 [compost metagenome]